MRTQTKTLKILGSILASLIIATPVLGMDQFGVRASFENRIVVPPDVNPFGANSTTATFFNGSTDAVEVPGLTDVYLSTSSFGQPLALMVPFPDFVKETLDSALSLLYYDKAATPENKNAAAFRYKTLLYGEEDVDGEIFIRAQFETMADYWGEPEKIRAIQAADILRNALRFAPWDRNLRRALLDIYYDTAVANITLAKEKEAEAVLIALEITPPSPGEFLISKEIELFESALPLYRDAISGYMALLSDPLGVDVTFFDSNPLKKEPFGYYLFRREVPSRSLLSPLFKDSNDNWVLPIDAGTGDTQAVLFNGYKDATLIFNTLRDYVRASGQLAKRYIMRGNPETITEVSDLDNARSLIGSVVQSTYIEAFALLDIFPDITNEPGNIDSASGLLESVASWRHEISNLGHLTSFINGDSNILGFTEDFLVLVQSIIPGDPQSQFFDSYDFFKAYLNNGTAGGPLSKAVGDWVQAKTDYVNYRDRNDQLALQFSSKNEAYDARLRAIVGVNPGEPGYDTPNQNEGSEIWQQSINIVLARKRIEANQQEISNLQEQIRIEIWRRGEEKGINDAISQVYLDYGDKQAQLTTEISKINASQAFSNNMAQAAASVSVNVGFPPSVSIGAGLFAFTRNASIQANAERRKGQKQAAKERLAARERAQVQSLQNDLLDINSRAQIKTWLLRMNILAIESAEASLVLQQEFGKLTALYNEKEDLERRRQESNELLADRFFADPSHRLIKDSSTLRADLSFEEAQQWLFLTARAAEYKWNQKFEHFYLGQIYTTKTLFKLRNSRELNDIFDAIADWDANISIGARNDDSYKKFSIRQDFLGFRNGGEYFDDVTGQLIPPFQAFQNYLGQDSLYLGPSDPENPIPGFKVIKLNFNTAYTPETGGLFLQNRWLEKIQYLRIKIFGGAVGGINSTVDGYLKYGGTSLIRNQTLGEKDPLNEDRLINETTEYSNQYWFFEQGEWKSKEAFGSSINAQVSNDPDVPPQVYQINDFQEYSVATTNWTLYLAVESAGGFPLVDIDNVTDIEFHLYFYWYARN